MGIKIKRMNAVTGSKIAAIKALRTVLHLGLKESKDIVDQAEFSAVDLVSECGLKVDDNAALTLSKYLSGTGYGIIQDSIENFEEIYGESLRAIASQAVLAGDDILAERVISLIKEFR
jgi:hypothetical protein